ncbi:hypothetical protein GCM10022221_39830 [Actinocorallia aurea]
MAHEELIAHLCRTGGLEPGEAARIVGEVLFHFGEPVEEYVRRRHAELRDQGVRNEQIFERIARELPERRVLPPELSVRQLRRIVYG